MAVIEYERKMHDKNLELSETMAKHKASLFWEAQNLRLELADAEKKVWRQLQSHVVIQIHKFLGMDTLEICYMVLMLLIKFVMFLPSDFKAAIEYERKLHDKNIELSETMEKHKASLFWETRNLCLKLADAEKKAIAAVTCCNPDHVSGYVTHPKNLGNGYVGSSIHGSYTVEQEEAL